MKWKTLAIFLVIFVVQVRSGPYGDYYDEYDETNDYDQHAPETAVENGSNDYHDRDDDWDGNGVTDSYNNELGPLDTHDDHHGDFDPSSNDLPLVTPLGGDSLWPTLEDGNGNDIHQPPYVRREYEGSSQTAPGRSEPVGPYRPQELPARPYDASRPQPGLEDKDRRDYPYQTRPYAYNRTIEERTQTGQTDQYGRPETTGPYRPQELPEDIDNRARELDQRQRYPQGTPQQPRRGERPAQPERVDPYGRPETTGPYRPQELTPASGDLQPDSREREQDQRQRYPGGYPERTRPEERQPQPDRTDPYGRPESTGPYRPQELPYQPSVDVQPDTRERDYDERQRYPSRQPEQPRTEDRPSDPYGRPESTGPYRPQELPYQPSGDVQPDTREREYEERQRYPPRQPEQPRPEDRPTDPYGRPETAGPYRPQELPYQPSGEVQPDTREREYEERQRYPPRQPEQPRPEDRPTDPYGRPESTGPYRPQELPYQPSGDVQPDAREREYEERQRYSPRQPEQPRPEERPTQPERTDPYGRPESTGPYRTQELPYQPSGEVQPDAREREYEERQRYPPRQPEQPRPEDRPTDPYGRPESTGPYRPQELPYQPSVDVQPDAREREYEERQRYPPRQPEQPRPEDRPTDPYGRPETAGPYRPQELPYQPSVDVQPDTREREYEERQRYPSRQPDQPRPEDRPTDPYGRPESTGPYRSQELPYQPSGDVQPDTREREYEERQRYPPRQPEQPRPEDRPTDPYGRPETAGPYRPQELPYQPSVDVQPDAREREYEERQRYPPRQPEQPRPEERPTDPYGRPEPAGPYRPQELPYQPSVDVQPDTREREYEERQRYPPRQPEQPRPEDRPTDPYGRPESTGPYRPQELPYQPSVDVQPDAREREYEERQRYPPRQPEQPRPEERPTQPERTDPYGRPELPGPYRSQELPYQPSGDVQPDTREREYEERQRYPPRQPVQPHPEERPTQPERTDPYGRPEPQGPYRPQELPYQPPATSDVHPDVHDREYYPRERPPQVRPEERPAQPESAGRPEPTGPYRSQELPYQPQAGVDVQPDTRERGYDPYERYPDRQPDQRRPEERPTQPERTDPYGRPEPYGPYRPQEPPVAGEVQPDTREREYESRQPYPQVPPEQPRPEERPTQPEGTDPYGRPEPTGPYRPQELPYQPPVSGEVRPETREQEYDPRQRYPSRPEVRPVEPERTDPYGRPEQTGPYRPQELPYDGAPTDPYEQPGYPYIPRPEEPEHRQYEDPYQPGTYDRPDLRDPYGHYDPRRPPVDPRQRYPPDRAPAPPGSVIVEIPGLGSVAGQVKRTATTSQTVYTFSNVRYAESPRGQRRFQPPEPVKPWYGVHDGTRENSSCPAFVELRKVKALEGYSDVEDCLRLTVHTKNVTANLPVMVYVHGEFFFDGSAEEASPEYLLEKDVVLVGVDYRLAPFGFISTLSPNVPGNVAVLDVIESLKWVQRNIRHFGGDPSSVTVFGQGAGAALVHVLTFSPAVPTGLFHRVILQSGSALSPFFVTDNPLKHAQEIAKRAGCQVSGRPGSFDDCLINLKPSQLLEAFMMYNQENEEKGHGHFGGFQLAIGDRNNVLPQQPRDLLRSWTGHSYPMIAGVTRNVGSFVYKKIAKLHERELLQQFNVDRAFKHIVDYLTPPSTHPQWQKTFRESLLLDPRTHNISYVAPSLIDLAGDVVYKTPVFDAAEMNWINQGAETFVYTFDFKGRYNRYNISTYRGLGFIPGVSLSDDNIYLFPYPLRVSGLVGWEQDVSRILVDLWTSFAEIGRPTSTYSNYVFWEPLSRPQGPYIKINNVVERGEDLRDELARTAAEVYRSRSRF